MKSIVLELQQLASDSSCSVTDLLRKALMVATKLDLPDFREWIKHELDGYKPAPGEVPAYRIVRTFIMYHNPYHGWQPIIFGDAGLADQLATVDTWQSVAELEAVLASKTGQLIVPFDDPTAAEVAKRLPIRVAPTRVVDRSRVIGILETVRNRILEWALELERQEILGEGLTFNSEERERAQREIHIEHFTGVLGDVHSSQLQIGDYNSIHTELKRLGIPQVDRNELENLLDEYRRATGSKKAPLAKRGLAWVLKHAKELGTLGETIRRWFQNGG